MQKNIRKLIALLIIILIIIILIIFILMKMTRVVNTDEVKIKEFEVDKPKGTETRYEKTNEHYYEVKEIISEYYTQISNMNASNKDIVDVLQLDEEAMQYADEGEIKRLKEYVKQNEEKAKKEVYYRLGKEYIEEYGITLENIKEKFDDILFEELIIDEMLVTNEKNAIYTYFVSGDIINKSKETLKFQLMVIVDRAKRCYAIYPQEYMHYHEYNPKQVGEHVQVVESHNEIEKNNYNTYENQSISSERKVQDLLENFRIIAESIPNSAINKIDSEYFKIRFANEQDALEYIKKKGKAMRICFLDTYNVENKEGYTQYTCEDTKGNYYIFKEISPFNYTVILDNYTVPNDEFTSQYKASSETEKVIINIDKFFRGINEGNYGYSYSVLSEAFKTNKYPTRESFIKYIKNNLFEQNNVKYIKYAKENGVYTYKIKVTDAKGKDTTQKEYNIVIKLNSGTDFEMSFSAD